MKEKTFEELALDESFRMNFGNEEVPMVKVYDVVQLMQQVREATKAEIMERVIELNGQEYREPIKKIFDEFPTNRILTDK